MQIILLILSVVFKALYTFFNMHIQFTPKKEVSPPPPIIYITTVIVL